MNPFARRMQAADGWVWPTTLVSLVLGFMISSVWVTAQNRRERIASLDSTQRSRVSLNSIDIEEFEKLKEEVQKLREDKTKLENAVADKSSSTKILNDQLQESKNFGGLVEVEGPGVVVTLRDSAQAGPQGSMATIVDPETVIHDLDVLKVVNELNASGAEAISVNNLRVVGTTSIRCVGPTILVDGTRISTPVVIRAIGDRETLYSGMNMPGGALAAVRGTDPAMVTVEKVDSITLPAFTGSTARKLAKTIEKKQ